MISNIIFTCSFNFPEYMDCNVRYQIPNPQTPASPSLLIEAAATDSSAIYLIVCTAGQPIAVINMAMHKTLVSEVLKPTKTGESPIHLQQVQNCAAA
jgi:hypothetical protein